MSDIDDLLKVMRREREEMTVKLGLAKLEARDDWKEVEKKWQAFRSRSTHTMAQAGDAGEDIAAAGRLLAEEMRNAYRRIRNSL